MLLLIEVTVGVLGVPGVDDMDVPKICGRIRGMAEVAVSVTLAIRV